MICTFGDVTDVVWWRELDLPNRAIIGFDGRIIAEAPDAITTEAGVAAFGELAGKTAYSAKQAVVEQLRASGDLLGEPQAITHPVKFFEKGERPLEIVSTRQWYIVNGARDESLKARLLDLGREIDWHPDFMRVRYENWVGGLSGDWLISRQRFFGVPIPVWYPLDGDGNPVFDEPIVATREQLPVDPSSAAAPGYEESQRGEPGGFVGEHDVMDTWATSSLTPQLAGGWERDPELFDLIFPYSLRPQAQDIIRTWLFSTVLRAQLEHGAAPWSDTAISGFIVDPDRKKMSKSKGNVVTPAGLLEQHGSDAVRYWAASSRLGVDAAFDPQNPTQVKIGRRLAIKVLNAAKFILGFDGRADAAVTVPVDRSMLAQLAVVVEQATRAFEAYDHARALEVGETFFWTFCDDYLELVKERAYGAPSPEQASAVAALKTALSVLLRLFAPVIPFATEEAWRWSNDSSVHVADWPTVEELAARHEAGVELLELASLALTGIRRAKTDAKASQKTPVASATIAAPAATIALLETAAHDLRAVGRIAELGFAEADDFAVRDIVLEVAPA
jgi:valyl-tRNA synthetase